MAVLLLVTDHILILVGQDPEAAKYAVEYIRPMTAALFFTGMFDIQRRFLSALGKPTVPMLL